jgi:hypothetical protein
MVDINNAVHYSGNQETFMNVPNQGVPTGSLPAAACRLRGAVCSLLTVFLLAGCAHQGTKDEKTYRVASPAGTNYYRVRIESSAWNGKAYFKAGLYPAYAVDMFRGQEVEIPTEMIDAETDMRREVIKAQTKALKAYLEAKDDKQRQVAAETLIAVQEINIGEGGRLIGTNKTERLQFSPVRSLVDYTANKKFVIALSSDPDEILNQISSFVEEAKTSEAIQDAITSQLPIGGQMESARLQARKDSLKAFVARLEEHASEDVTNAAQLAALISKLNAAVEGLK